MTMVSIEVLLSKFQMPSCFSHLAHPLAYLAVPDPFLWGYITCNIPPANINESK